MEESTADTRECDCFAHTYGNAADNPSGGHRYPTDMTDTEWSTVRGMIPVPAWGEGRGGRPEEYCHRDILDAIRYVVDNGVKWPALPADYPPWKAVHRFFTRWRKQGLIDEFHDRLRAATREAQGRNAEPTAGVIDSQSAKSTSTVEASTSGYDGGKKIKGRKRHIVVDTLGLILAVVVTPASTGDRDAAQDLLSRATSRHHRLRRVWADSGYTGMLVGWCATVLNLMLTVIRRSDDHKGFVVLPKRWIVERTFAWLTRSRRLARDYERLPASSEAMILWSMTMIMTRRLGRHRRRTGPAPARAPIPAQRAA
ncbi:IS5 family transposase [Streptomyces sp. NPDC056159]|uniref:IS5 family transposase n=1 Tax=Streptomyces sp. NPDC056159 TaxID=3155537 RepID=UPI003438EDC0